MSKTKPGPSAKTRVSSANPADNGIVYTVRQIIPAKLLCNTIQESSNGAPPASPLARQVIKLTAIVADADGNPPTEAMAVNWTYVDGSLLPGTVWWYTALNQIPVRDQATTYTLTNGLPDTIGTTSIWVAGTEPFAGNVGAATSGQAAPGSQLTLAVWDFDGANDYPPVPNEELLPQPVFSVSSGSTITIPDYDWGDSSTYNPRNLYADSEDVYPSAKVAQSAVYFIRHWNYKDNKDVLLRPPQVYTSASFKVDIPYDIMNTDVTPNANAVTYCFYSVFNPYSSKNFVYSASGTALWAPDVKNLPMTGKFVPVLYVEPDVEDDWQTTTDSTRWPKISDAPPVITKSSFGQKSMLNFAIPIYENWNQSDVLIITAYLNAYFSNGAPHNTTAAPPGSNDPYMVRGSDFSDHFTGKLTGRGQKYALVQFAKSDMGDFESDEFGDNGIMFVQYVVNSKYYSSLFLGRININP